MDAIIANKPTSDEYREGFDRIVGKKSDDENVPIVTLDEIRAAFNDTLTEK